MAGSLVVGDFAFCEGGILCRGHGGGVGGFGPVVLICYMKHWVPGVRPQQLAGPAPLGPRATSCMPCQAQEFPTQPAVKFPLKFPLKMGGNGGQGGKTGK